MSIDRLPSGADHDRRDRWATVTRRARALLMTMRGLRYDPVRRRRNRRKTPLRVYWYDRVPNFGDTITPEIITRLFGYRVQWSPMKDCELIGAGSILHLVDANRHRDTPLKVWGSGFIASRGDESKADSLEFHAVRGSLTRSLLHREWGTLPLGDPGLLADLAYPAARQRTQKIGVVPHYVDRDHPLIARMRDDDRFLVMEVSDSAATIAHQISGCRLVLSSSLHGLIFADSFSVPNIHMELSDKVIGDGFKFRDHCSAVGKTYRKADLTRLLDDEYLQEVERAWKPIENLRSIQRGLIRAFPY